MVPGLQQMVELNEELEDKLGVLACGLREWPYGKGELLRYQFQVVMFILELGFRLGSEYERFKHRDEV